MQMNPDVLIWLSIGVALLSSEALSGTFHLLFFGLSALMTGVLAALGLSSTVAQLVIFAIGSVLGVVLVRKKWIVRSKGFSQDSEIRIVLSADLAAGREGPIQYQGVPWTAVNASSQSLLKGERVRVLRTEGNKLIVEPDVDHSEEGN